MGVAVPYAPHGRSTALINHMGLGTGGWELGPHWYLLGPTPTRRSCGALLGQLWATLGLTRASCDRGVNRTELLVLRGLLAVADGTRAPLALRALS